MSDCHSTRSHPGRPPAVHLEHARAAIDIYRAGGRGAVPLEQLILLARLRVRVQGRANRHELGTWHADPAAADVEGLACIHCGARATLSRATAVENLAELLEACRS